MSTVPLAEYILLPFDRQGRRWRTKRARIKLDRAKAKGSQVELDPETVRFVPDWLESANAVAEGLDIITDIKVKDDALGNAAVLEYRDPKEIQVFAKTKPKGKTKPIELDGKTTIRLEIQLQIHWEAVPDYDEEYVVNDAAGEAFCFTPDGESTFKLLTWVDEFLPGASSPWIPNKTDYQFTHHIAEDGSRAAGLLASEPTPTAEDPAARREDTTWKSGKALPDEQFPTLPLALSLKIEAWPNDSVVHRADEASGQRPSVKLPITEPWGSGSMGISLEFAEWTLEFEKHGWDEEKQVALTLADHEATVRAINSPRGAHLTARLLSAYYSPKNYVDHRKTSPQPEVLYPITTLLKKGKEICVISKEGDKEEHGEKREKVVLEYTAEGRPKVTFGDGQTAAPDLEVSDWLPAKEVYERFEETEQAADQLVSATPSGAQSARAEFERYFEKFFGDYLEKDGEKLVADDEDRKRLQACQQMGTFCFYSQQSLDFHAGLSKLRNEAAMNLTNLLIAWMIDILLFDWRTWRSGWKGIKEAGEKAAREAMEKAARKEALEEASEQAGKEIDELAEQGREVAEEISTVRSDLSEATRKIEDAKGAAKEAEDSIKGLDDKIKTLREEAKEIQEEAIPKLQQEVGELEGRLATETTREGQVKAALRENDSSIQKLTDEIDELTAAKPGAMQDAADAARNARQAKNAQETLERQAKEQLEKAQGQSAKVSGLQDDVGDALSDAQRAEGEWLRASESATRARSFADDLEEAAQQASRQAQEAADDVTALNDTLGTLTRQQREAEATLRGMTNASEEAIEAQQAAIRTYQNGIDEINSKLPEMTRRAEAFADHAAQAGQRANQASDLAREASETAENLSQTHSRLQARHSTLKTQHAEEMETLVQEQSRYMELTEAVENQKVTVDELSKEATRLDDAAKKIDGDIEVAKGKRQATEQAKEAHEQELEGLSERIGGIEEQIEGKRQAITDSRVEAANKRTQAVTDEEKIGEWETKHSEAQDTVTEQTKVRDELEELRGQHKEKLTDINERKRQTKAKQKEYDDEAREIGAEIQRAEEEAQRMAEGAEDPSSQRGVFELLGAAGRGMLKLMEWVVGKWVMKILSTVASTVWKILQAIWGAITTILSLLYKLIQKLVLNLIDRCVPVVKSFYQEMIKQLTLYDLAGAASSEPTLSRAWVGVGDSMGAGSREAAKSRMRGEIESKDKAHANEVTQALHSNLSGAIKASVEAALLYKSSDDINGARDRCDECSGRLLMFKQNEQGGVHRAGSKIYQPGQAFGAFSDFERTRTWRDYVTLFDWVQFIVTWTIRIAAVIGGIAAGPIGVGYAFIAMQVADAIDVVMGGLKSFVALYGDLIPKDKMLVLGTLMPWFIHAGCFKAAPFPKTAWIDDASSMMSAIGDMLESPIEAVKSALSRSFSFT